MKNFNFYYYRCQKELEAWNAPLSGWYCVEVIDVIGEDDESEDYFTCELCGCSKVRYVHVMEHHEYFERISVGCICAGIMEGDILAAEERERKIKNRLNRRKTFIKKKWRPLPDGNYILSYKGTLLYILDCGEKGYCVSCGVDRVWRYNNRPIKDFLSACYAAFDYVDPVENCYE